jgi:molybdenum cofactor biosynthesis enzyme MoaA
MNMITKLLLETEVAEFLRVSKRTLERWRMNGTGPSFRKHGRRIVYDIADLNDWSGHHKFSSTSNTISMKEKNND